MHIQTLPEIRPIPTYLLLRKTETFVGRMTNGCLLLVIEMQSDVWQEIPDFDGADVEQKWIEGNPGYNLRVLHWTPTNEDCKRARTLVMIPGWNSVPEGWFRFFRSGLGRDLLFTLKLEKKEAVELKINF